MARPGRQCGQAYAEYLVVTITLFTLMFAVSLDPSLADFSLVLAFKSLFSAYSFTLSLP